MTNKWKQWTQSAAQTIAFNFCFRDLFASSFRIADNRQHHGSFYENLASVCVFWQPCSIPFTIYVVPHTELETRDLEENNMGLINRKKSSAVFVICIRYSLIRQIQRKIKWEYNEVSLEQQRQVLSNSLPTFFFYSCL